MNGKRIQGASGFFQFVDETLFGSVAILNFVGCVWRRINLDAFLFIQKMDNKQTKHKTNKKDRKGNARKSRHNAELNGTNRRMKCVFVSINYLQKQKHADCVQ